MPSNHRRLTIAVLHRTFRSDAGGAEAYAVAIALELAKRHDVHVFAQEMDPTLQGVIFHPIPLFFKRPRWLNQLWFALASWLMTRQGFDIVHSHENTWHGNIQTVHVIPMRCKHVLPLGLWRRTVHSLNLLSSPRLLAYWALERGRFGFHSHRHWVAVSKPLQQRLQRMRPALPIAQLHCIAPGIYPPSDSEANHSPVPSPMRNRLLWVGNDAEKKNIGTVLRALALLDTSYTLTVAGHARPTLAWQETAATLGLTHRVHFLGVVSHMAEVYACADILLHPTLEDTFGMVVLEAMANGLAVVVSHADYCGVSADLSHGVNAYILNDPMNPEAIAHAVKHLSDTLVFDQYKTHAMHFAKQHAWSDVAAQYEALFEEVVETQ